MTKLKLLFIVPHYNNARKLKRCIDSIHQNTSDNYNFKILIIDDFSEIKIRNLLKNFEEIGNIHVIYLNKNMGISNARNYGLSYAMNNQFTHVTFIDCDDHLINKIQIIDFKDSELTIYESIETNDLYDKYNEYHKFFIKLNTNDIYDWRKILVQYSTRPNTVRFISSCWSKIYLLKPIIENKLFFNTKMKTFEDVHFLLRYLMVSNKLVFKKIPLYAHTNSSSYASATFAVNKDPNTLFSFLMLPNILVKLFKKFNISEKFDRHHFLACYYSIIFIMLAINRKNILSAINLYFFIKKRLKSNLVQRCFRGYNWKLAGGRLSFKILTRLNMPLVLSAILIYIAKKRYPIKIL